MKKVDIKKLAGVGALSVGLVFGMAGFAGAQSGSIVDTGPGSNNEIDSEVEYDFEYRNDTDLDLDNDVDQDAESGDAEVEWNNTGGDAESGSAMNESAVTADIVVENTSAASWSGGGGMGTASFDGSIENTGPGSNNEVDFEYDFDVDVDNDTNIDINNDVNQDADSGDAEVRGNTNGGSATSGSVSNTSSSSFTVHVSN